MPKPCEIRQPALGLAALYRWGPTAYAQRLRISVGILSRHSLSLTACPLLVIGERERNRPALRIDADSFPPRIASMFAPLLDNSVWEERPLIQGAVEVLEISKMQEIVTTLANLRDAALQLPDGPERQNALREIKDFQIRLAAFVRRLCSTA